MRRSDAAGRWSDRGQGGGGRGGGGCLATESSVTIEGVEDGEDRPNAEEDAECELQCRLRGLIDLIPSTATKQRASAHTSAIMCITTRTSTRTTHIDACIIFVHIYVHMREIAYMYPARAGSEGKPAQAVHADRPDPTQLEALTSATRVCHLHDKRWLLASQCSPSKRVPAGRSHAHRQHSRAARGRRV